MDEPDADGELEPAADPPDEPPDEPPPDPPPDEPWANAVTEINSVPTRAVEVTKARMVLLRNMPDDNQP